LIELIDDIVSLGGFFGVEFCPFFARFVAAHASDALTAAPDKSTQFCTGFRRKLSLSSISLSPLCLVLSFANFWPVL
jgi:hypothetical protein